MAGMFTIIKKNATKFRMLKIPATTYSWKTALILKVIRRQAYALSPHRRQGK